MDISLSKLADAGGGVLAFIVRSGDRTIGYVTSQANGIWQAQTTGDMSLGDFSDRDSAVNALASG